MRKFMKGCAITALIFILLGLILGVSGSLGNGSTHFSPGEILSAVTLGRISEEKVDDWSDGVTEQIRENMGDVHYDLEDNVDYDSDYEVKSGKIELYVLGDDSQGITDLQVQAGVRGQLLPGRSRRNAKVPGICGRRYDGDQRYFESKQQQ